MLSVSARVALLGVAQVARLLCDRSWLSSSDYPFDAAPLTALTAALLLPPLMGPLLSIVSPSLLLLFAGLALPLAVLWPVSGAAGLLLVGAGSLLFQLVLLLRLADLCAVGRFSLPRVACWLGAVCAAAGLIGPTSLSQPLLLSLAILAILAGLMAMLGGESRTLPLGAALGGFWIDLLGLAGPRRPSGEPSAREFFVGLLAFAGMVTAGLSVVSGEELSAVLVGIVVGCLVASWQWNPWRSPAMVPLGGFAMTLALGLMAWLGTGPTAPRVLLGVAIGLGLVPLLVAYLSAIPPAGRANGLAVLVGAFVPVVLLIPWVNLGWLVLLAALFTGVSVYWLLQQFLEQIFETPGIILSRVTLVGPGAETIPTEGPLIIVANHAAYFDPLWVCRIVPRKVVAMMTSVFYDLPFIRWLMVHMSRAIRVPAATVRREAPELQEAIRVLQAGGCLLIFPEARLRKSEEKMLFPFGQGLWHILRAVPHARLMAVWIEGSWGSWTSHGGGKPPLVGKPMDLRRRIKLAMSAAAPVAPEYLADREVFRSWVMGQVLACRAYVGLPVPTVAQALGRLNEPMPEESQPRDVESGGNR